MKLNEARLIAQILRLANAIKESQNISEIHSNADGIISICNIIDTDTPSVPFGTPPIVVPTFNQELSVTTQVTEQDLFKQAKEEQQSGGSNIT